MHFRRRASASRVPDYRSRVIVTWIYTCRLRDTSSRVKRCFDRCLAIQIYLQYITGTVCCKLCTPEGDQRHNQSASPRSERDAQRRRGQFSYGDTCSGDKFPGKRTCIVRWYSDPVYNSTTMWVSSFFFASSRIFTFCVIHTFIF